MKFFKKFGIIILAGILTCSAPAAVPASSLIESILEDDQISALLSDPDQIADLIISAKSYIDAQDITDENIRDAIGLAADSLEISLDDSQKDFLVDVVKKVKDMDIDEEELREGIKEIYDDLESAGIGKDEVKGFLSKAADFVKSLIE